MTVGFWGQQSYGMQQYQQRSITSGHISEATQNWGIAGLAANLLGSYTGGEEGQTLNTLGNLFSGIAGIRAQHETSRYEEVSYANTQQYSSWGGNAMNPWDAPMSIYNDNNYQFGGYNNYQFSEIHYGKTSEATQNWQIAGLAANILGEVVGGNEGKSIGIFGDLFSGIGNIREMHEVNTVFKETYSSGNWLSNWNNMW